MRRFVTSFSFALVAAVIFAGASANSSRFAVQALTITSSGVYPRSSPDENGIYVRFLYLYRRHCGLVSCLPAALSEAEKYGACDKMYSRIVAEREK